MMVPDEMKVEIDDDLINAVRDRSKRRRGLEEQTSSIGIEKDSMTMDTSLSMIVNQNTKPTVEKKRVRVLIKEEE
jgi:hypothetical protein